VSSTGYWSEWDGRGHTDALGWVTGWETDAEVAKRELRRLGFDVREVILLHSWSGYVDGDDIPDACTVDGETLEIDGLYVDADTIIKTTFAFDVIS
jgi:hypothetical protein